MSGLGSLLLLTLPLIMHTTFCWPIVPTSVIPNVCDATPLHVQRLVILFERPYVDPRYQYPLFLMHVMQHHHTHTVWSSCLKTHMLIHRPNTRYSSCVWCNTITRTPSGHPVWKPISWSTVPTPAIRHACDATPSHAHRLVILFGKNLTLAHRTNTQLFQHHHT